MRGAVRWMLLGAGVVAGLGVGAWTLPTVRTLVGGRLPWWGVATFVGLVAALGGLLGLVVAPWVARLVWRATQRLEGRLQRASFSDLVAGIVGLIIGLIPGALLSSSLSRIPVVGSVLPTAVDVVLAYLALSLALARKADFLPWLGNVGLGTGSKGVARGGHKVVDTSAIIDGRIADIIQAGFLEGTLVIPSFVLEELRHIADSSDVLRRNRGRRGLDVLNRIQKELAAPVLIYERDLAPNLEVDAKLIRLAQHLHGKIVTQDYNLNKVAAVQNVAVLNVNELANSLRPVVLPGEEMQIQIVRDGKEPGQGVAFLDDGTMIVVDGGKRYMGETLGVQVTSVLQTSAGRMIFARPKYAERVAP